MLTRVPAAVTAALLVGFALLSPAFAQDKPRSGGELIFLVPSEPPSYDGHKEGTFGVVHPLAPHYNTLLRIDPFDRTGTKVVPDLAESWTVSPDGLTYRLKLRNWMWARSPRIAATCADDDEMKMARNPSR